MSGYSDVKSCIISTAVVSTLLISLLLLAEVSSIVPFYIKSPKPRFKTHFVEVGINSTTFTIAPLLPLLTNVYRVACFLS